MSLAKKLLNRLNEHILRDSAAASSDGGETLSLQAALNKFLIPKGIITNEYKFAAGVREGAVINGVTITNPMEIYVGYLGTAELLHDKWKVEPYDSVLATEAIHISTSIEDVAGAVQDRLDQVNFQHINSDEESGPKTLHFGTIVQVIDTFTDGTISDQKIGKKVRITAQGDKTEDLDCIGDLD